MPSQQRFEAGDIVICVDDTPWGGFFDCALPLKEGKAYLALDVSIHSGDVIVGSDGTRWMADRFRRARLNEIVEYAKTNPRPFFKVGDLVTCVSSDDSTAGLTAGQTYRVTDTYAGQFISTAGALLEEAKHQYVGVAWANGRRRSGQSFLRFRQATPAEIEAFNKEAVSPTTPSPTTSSPTTSGLGPVVVQCQGDIARANAAIAIPSDGCLESLDGRKFGIVEWKPSSCLDDVVRIDVKLQPEVPKVLTVSEPAVVQPPKLYSGDQVVLSAKGRQNAELKKFLDGKMYAIISDVRSNGSIWITVPDSKDESGYRIPWRSMSVAADEIVPVGRDYYLVPKGTIIEEGDEFWDDRWRKVVVCVGCKLCISNPLRRRKPKSLDGQTIKAREFVKVLGPSRELVHAPYWNPIMSNMIGKVFCVDELGTYASSPTIRIRDERGDPWSFNPDWVSRPTEGEIKAYQDSLAKVGNVVLCTSFSPTGERLYRICEVNKKPSGEFAVLMESETLVRRHASTRTFFRLATEQEANEFTSKQDVVRDARTKMEAVSIKHKAGPTFAVEVQQFEEFQDVVDRIAEGSKLATESSPTITWNTPESLPFSKMEMEFKWEGRFKDEAAAASSAFKGLQKAMKDKITVLSEGIKIEGVVDSLASSALSTEGQMNVSLKVIPTSVTVETKAPKPSSECPAEPGEGYRFLEPEELVVEGDEFWGNLGSGSYGWLPTNNHRVSNGEQCTLRYRRRNKFAVGELVRIVKPLPGMHRQPGISWVPAMDKHDGGVFTIYRLDTDGTYGLVGDDDPYWYAPSWLAPASSSQREKAQKAEKPSSECPAEPGEGYRFLEPEELVVEGDEYWCTDSHKWCLSSNYRRTGKQGVSTKYRRRNKFTKGELVRLVKPLDTSVGPGWVPSFNRWIEENKAFTITHQTPQGNYGVAGSSYFFHPNWLAPASEQQKQDAKEAEEAKKAQIADLESKMKDIQSQLDSLRK